MLITPNEHDALEQALAAARRGTQEGGMPFGAALVAGDAVIGAACNTQIQSGDFFAHAEMQVLRQRFERRSGHLADATLVATEAPCLMCAGAALNAGIRRFIIGETVHFRGAVEELRAYGAHVEDLADPQCIALVGEFRSHYPDLWGRFSAG